MQQPSPPTEMLGGADKNRGHIENKIGKGSGEDKCEPGLKSNLLVLLCFVWMYVLCFHVIHFTA